MTGVLVTIRSLMPASQRGISTGVIIVFAWLGHGIGGYQSGLFIRPHRHIQCELCERGAGRRLQSVGCWFALPDSSATNHVFGADCYEPHGFLPQ
jgi:hypothetical protein